MPCPAVVLRGRCSCRKKNNIVVATLGDAASRQGEFYEAIAFAVERQLPILLIVEDNNYGISTNTEKFNPFKLGIFGDDVNLVHVDARHPDRVYEAAAPAVDHARSGNGPTVMVCQLDRLCSHTSSDDQRVYRPQDEIDAMSGARPDPGPRQRIDRIGSNQRRRLATDSTGNQ